jgi:probable phosphoglycerate mutase
VSGKRTFRDIVRAVVTGEIVDSTIARIQPIRRREWLRVLGAGCGSAAANGPLQAKSQDLRIYLARHGESDANASHIVAGWTDSLLTAKGRQQAHDLSEALQGVHLDAIYSSTLARSRDTAVIVAAGRRVESLPELRERNSGRFERGPNNAEGYLRRRFVEDDDLDGGETPAQFLRRVDAAIAGIIRHHPAGTIVIVGHGGTNQKILQSLFKLRSEQANGIVQDNDEVYSIDLVGSKPLRLWKLIREKNLSDL